MPNATARISALIALVTVLCFTHAPSALAQTTSPIFTPGNLVVSVEGNGVVGGSGTYGDNQAAPLTLFQYTPNGTSSASFVNSLVLPQTGSGANVPVSGEYGSSSEGTIQLSGSLQYLTVMGYGVNAAAFNADPTLYGNAGGELGQSGSLTGQGYTPVPRVTALIDPYGNVNSSTALFNIFNANNPRGTYTVDGLNIYVSGQGTSGDNTGGVFYTTLGSSSATSIVGDDGGGTASQDTRDVQIYNNTLYVSMDSKSGAYNRSYIGTLGDPPATSVFTCTGVGAGCPTGDGTIGPALMAGFGNTGGTGREKLTAAQTNGLSPAGDYINLSPENFFFASPTVLYVADSGSPKNTSADNESSYTLCGAGGLQKWVNVSGTWTWEYTLYQGLNLVANSSCSSNTDGTTGLIGLAGVVVGSNVYLYATNYTIADLDPTYLYGITDVLSATTNPGGESFTQLAAAPADSNFKGVSLAPTLPAGSATITSSPSGLAFTSTGTGCASGTYTTPVTLIWTPGVSCALSVVSPQTASGAQYSFAQWQDGTTSTTDNVTAPNTAAVFTASFTTTTSISVSSVTPSNEDYGADSPVTITAALSWAGNGPAPTASDVTIGGNGNGTYGSTSCAAPSGDSMICTAIYTPTTADLAGSYTETATFAGDTNYTGSSSAQTNNFTINNATSTTAVTSSGSPSVYGQPVTFTATISAENGAVKGRTTRKNGVKSQIVTGSVNWSSNTGCGTTSVTSGTPGTATCTTSSLTVGSDSVTATYSGDSNHGGSSGSVSQSVNQATTSIGVTSVNPSNEDYGLDSPVTITAALSWTGGGAAPTASAVTISGNGSGSYGPTSCGAASGNTLTCSATYTPTTADGAGTYTETASFAGDTNYTGSSSAQTGIFTINQASATTVVTSSLNPSTYGHSVTFTATISGEDGAIRGNATRKNGARSQAVSGTVNWSANTGCGTTTVTSGNPGVATCTTTSLGGGSDTITASYSGDSNHGASSGSFSQTVNPATQTISFTTVPPPDAVYNTQFTVAATASSGLGVTFTSAGGCSNSGATYTMTSGTTTCSVIASQSGNANYSAATSITKTVAAVRARPTVTFTGLSSSLPYNNSFPLTATTNASTTAAISSSTPAVCSLSGTMATIVADKGTCTVSAQWAEDANYISATAAQSGTATKGVVTITWGAPAPITYGTALSSTQLDASANVGGTFTYAPAAGKVEEVGSYTLKTTFTPGSADYPKATATVSLQVTPAATTTTFITNSESVNMNADGVATASVDFAVSSYKPVGAVTLAASTGEVCSGTVVSSTGDGRCSLIFTTTGPRTITATYGGDANHTGSTSTTPITITVNPHE